MEEAITFRTFRSRKEKETFYCWQAWPKESWCATPSIGELLNYKDWQLERPVQPFGHDPLVGAGVETPGSE